MTTPQKARRLNDRERTRAAAVEALVGAAMAIGGALLGGSVGIALVALGIIGLVHAVLLGLGVVRLPDEPRRARKRG